MSKNGKIDYPDGKDDREDIQWFENYEKRSKTKHLEKLKNEDILNYIKDVERNCRLEVNSGDEDYAGTKKSSNCSVRCSGTRFRSFKKIKSRVMRKNNNMDLKKERKQFPNHNACNYCCSARQSYFRGNSNFAARENRKDLSPSTKSLYQHPNLSRNSYKYHESSPTFYNLHSRKNKTWSAATEVASLDVTEDWSQNAVRDSTISRSKITDRKSKVHTFKSLRGNKHNDSCYTNRPSNEKMTERNSRYRNWKHREEPRMGKLNEESDASNFENQQPLNKIYSGLDETFSYQAPLQNKKRSTSGYHYPVRRSKQPTSSGLNSRSNRLMASERLPKMSSLLQGRTSQWENEIGPPLKASSSIKEASIDKSYQRVESIGVTGEANRKNNTDQRRRRPNILGDRESPCYGSLFRESEKLCKVLPANENKQWLGCYENVERDETADCSRYYYRPENANDFIQLQCENTRRPIPINNFNYTATNCKSVHSRDNNEEESEINLSMEEYSQSEVYNNVIDLRDLESRMLFLDDQARRGATKMSREYKKLSSDLKKSQGEAMGERTALRKKITARYPMSKEFSFAIRTAGRPESGDSSGLRYDAAESTCECKEPFYNPPATCLTGSCTCIGNNENAERNDSRRISDTVCCCYCCSCSCTSVISRDERDPVKKLESFCERVKAVNQDILHNPSKSTCRNRTRTNAQEYAREKQNQSEFSAQRTMRGARSIEREWLTDPARLRLEKPKHGGENLEKILIYPPRGEGGPPLPLYKRSSNISCRVKGDANTGFRYNVTYVQKFISPTWMPSLSPEILSWETDNKEYDCSADYG